MFSAVASDLSTVQIVPSQSCGCGCAGDNCVVLPILAVELVVTDLPVVVHRKPRVGDFYFRAAYASQMFFFFPTYSAVCKVNALSVSAAS